MINTTRWRPDTCGCIINYDWDTELPDNAPTLNNIEQSCPAHSELTDSECYDAVKDENSRKNKVLGIVLDNYNSVRKSVTNDDNEHQHYELKDTASYDWSFDDNRVLQVNMNQLETADKTDLQTRANLNFGLGKVSVN